jgi:hypothetical protein
MAEGTLTEPAYVARLTEALHRELPTASIAHEPVRRDRYRFIVVDNAFTDVGHPERQLKVWRIAEDVVEKTDIWNVAMIITMAPSELADDEQHLGSTGHQ